MKVVKKVAGVLSLSLLASNVYAVEVYNKDDTKVNLGGSIRFYTENSFNKKGEFGLKDDGTRISLSATTKINDYFDGFGSFEAGFNNLKNDGNYTVKTREGFVGMDFHQFGKVSFGKQYGAFYNVAEFTDRFNNNVDSALGYTVIMPAGSIAAVDKDGGFLGTYRADGSVKYVYNHDLIDVAAQFMGVGTQEGNGLYSNAEITRNNAFGASVIVKPIAGLKVGVAYNKANLIVPADMQEALDVKSKDYSPQHMVAGVSYENDMFVAAFNYGNITKVTKDYKSNAFETFFAFKYDQAGSLVYVGNQYGKSEDKDGRTDNNGDVITHKATVVNNVNLGVEHHFGKAMRTYIEYRHDLRSNADLRDVADFVNTDKDVSELRNSSIKAGVRYDF
jgi:outer membrane pore protein F